MPAPEKPKAAAPDKSKPSSAGRTPAPDPHAGHANAEKKPTAAHESEDPGVTKGDPKLPVLPAERVADPACPDKVKDPKPPTAVHQRKVYYFCSERERDEFRKDPAAYLEKRPR
jgi:YHS domain-containing protein